VFDTVKGRVVRSGETLQIAGSITIAVGGTRSESRLVQTQNTTILTSNTDPLKKVDRPKAAAQK
jgi:hypothetical protein